MSEVEIFLWGINENKKLIQDMCRDSVNTAKFYDIPTNFMGLGIAFTEHKQRVQILKNKLPTLDRDAVVVLMDGADTLFNDNKETLLRKFKEKNTRILISAERGFTYQYNDFKDKFDDKNSNCEYKYVNAGTFMGYAGDILNMVNDLIELDKRRSANDQGLLGMWVHENMDNADLVKMDVNCDVFWVTTGDWGTIIDERFSNNLVVTNPFTKTRPCVVHYTGKGDKHYVKGYNKLLKIILQEA